MSHPVTGIDHCYLLVRDLDASRAAYQRLGFTVSPRGLHSAELGTANHTIMFATDYAELIGIVAETGSNAEKRRVLAESGEGLRAVACRAGDVGDAGLALAALGIATSGRRDFARPVALPSGGEAQAAFSTLDFDPAEVPFGRAFMCQHHTPGSVWLPDLMTHANGATGLAGLVARADDPEAAAAGFARLFAAGRVDPVAGGFRVETGSAPITIVDDDGLARRYPGIDLTATPRGAFAALRIAVAELGTAERVLAGNGIAARATADGLAVGPEAASGAIAEFVAA